jgi:Flp pilus assembly protein TadD
MHGGRPLTEARLKRSAWRTSVVVIGAASIAAASACRPKPASVEDLYTTRMLGLSYLQRNELPQAESAFKKLTNLAPDDPLGYASLGLTYLQAGRYAEAEKQLRRARE